MEQVPLNGPMETSPTISMHIDLGASLEPGQIVEFYYDAFDESARTLAGSDIDASALSIEISPADPSRAGDYTIGSSRIRLMLTDKMEPNAALRHELQHYVDDLNGRFDNKFLIANNVLGNLAALGSSRFQRPMEIATVSLAAAGTIDYFHDGNLDFLTLYSVAGVAIASLSAAFLAGDISFRLNPAERSATKASRLDTPEIVVISG